MNIYCQNRPIGQYVYAYIRHCDSKNGNAGTPYYIGQGINKRAWCSSHKNHKIHLPVDKRYIVIIKDDLTKIGAWMLERWLIRWYGRLDLKSGILHNKTDGGPGQARRCADPDRAKELYVKKHEAMIKKNQERADKNKKKEQARIKKQNHLLEQKLQKQKLREERKLQKQNHLLEQKLQKQKLREERKLQKQLDTIIQKEKDELEQMYERTVSRTLEKDELEQMYERTVQRALELKELSAKKNQEDFDNYTQYKVKRPTVSPRARYYAKKAQSYDRMLQRTEKRAALLKKSQA